MQVPIPEEPELDDDELEPDEEELEDAPLTITVWLLMFPLFPWTNTTGIPIIKSEVNLDSGTVTGPLFSQKSLYICTMVFALSI